MRLYPINEMFLSIQGEATFAGTPAVFVRLQGCRVGCAFCDTKYTWPLEPSSVIPQPKMLAKVEDSPSFAEMTADEISTAVAAVGQCARHVVLTGGEPADHDLAPLEESLRLRGYRVQVETSGTAELSSGQAFITLSPKINQAGGMVVREDVVAAADELKHPCSTRRHLDELLALLERGWHRQGVPVWLQPLSVHPAATSRCVEWCKEFGFRLSLQTHKYLGIR